MEEDINLDLCQERLSNNLFWQQVLSPWLDTAFLTDSITLVYSLYILIQYYGRFV